MSVDKVIEARIAIASTRQILDALEERVEQKGVTDADLKVLAAIEHQAERGFNWILSRDCLAEMPQSIDAQKLERELWPIVARREPMTIGGVSID